MIKSKSWITLITLLALAACQARAYAHKIGAFDVNLSGSTRESFDDNITFTKENKKEDFITSARVGIEAVYEGKTRGLKLSGSILQNAFLDHTGYNSLAQDFTADFINELSKYDRIFLSDTYSRAQEPRSFEDAFGSTSGRYRIQKNEFSLGYSRDINSQYGLTARYSNAVNTYSRQDMADSYLNSLGLQFGYRESSEFSLSGAYDFTYRHFDPGSHAMTNSLGALARAYLTSRLYLDTSAGISFLNSYDKNSYVKPYLGMAVTDEFDENTKGTISFTKRYDTNAYSQDLFGYWRISCALTRKLTQRLDAECSFFFGDGEYRSLDIRDKLSGINLGLNYDFKDNIRGGLTYSYSRVDSTLSTREYAKNVVSAGLTVKF